MRTSLNSIIHMHCFPVTNIFNDFYSTCFSLLRWRNHVNFNQLENSCLTVFKTTYFLFQEKILVCNYTRMSKRWQFSLLLLLGELYIKHRIRFIVWQKYPIQWRMHTCDLQFSLVKTTYMFSCTAASSHGKRQYHVCSLIDELCTFIISFGMAFSLSVVYVSVCSEDFIMADWYSSSKQNPSAKSLNLW